MNFKKILDGVNIQGYKVCKPTKEFKKLFPKKYVLSLDMFGERMIFNTDSLPKESLVYQPVGYIFTYADSLPNSLINNKVKYTDVGGCFPSCLDTYFSGTDEKIDLILSISPRDKIVPARFNDEIVIQCNSEQLLKGNKLKSNIMTIINNYLKEGKFDVMTWVRKVIFNYPINNNGMPVRFPNKVSDKTINNCSIKSDELFVEYDFRAKSYDKEDELIVDLEDAFEDLNKEVIVYDNYNHILDKLKSALDKKKLKYNLIDNDKLKVKAKYLREVNLKYQLTDFM